MFPPHYLLQETLNILDLYNVIIPSIQLFLLETVFFFRKNDLSVSYDSLWYSVRQKHTHFHSNDWLVIASWQAANEFKSENRLIHFLVTQPVTANLSVLFPHCLQFEGTSIAGWDTALHAERSWIRIPMVSLKLFIDVIILAALWPWGRLSL